MSGEPFTKQRALDFRVNFHKCVLALESGQRNAIKQLAQRERSDRRARLRQRLVMQPSWSPFAGVYMLMYT